MKGPFFVVCILTSLLVLGGIGIATFLMLAAHYDEPVVIGSDQVLTSAAKILPLPADTQVVEAIGGSNFRMDFVWHLTFKLDRPTDPAIVLGHLAAKCNPPLQRSSKLKYAHQQGDSNVTLEYFPEQKVYKLVSSF